MDSQGSLASSLLAGRLRASLRLHPPLLTKCRPLLSARAARQSAPRRPAPSATRLDRPVHRLPGPHVAAVRTASQRQHLQLLAGATQYICVDETNSDLRQDYRRRPSTASRRADSARARNGLVRKSSAPSSKTRTSLSSSPFAVSTITGMFAVAGRERRCDSTP